MNGTKTAIENSIFWQKHVYAKSTNPAQKARCLASVDKLQAQLTALDQLQAQLTKGTRKMKRYLSYEAIPSNAIFLGAEDGAGHSCEALNDSLNDAINPVYIVTDGVKFFFDLVS
jgi:hypothetical protein